MSKTDAQPLLEYDGAKPFIDSAMGRAILPFAVAIAITSGMLFRGYDSAQGAVTCAFVNGLMLVAILLLRPPTLYFWMRMKPILMLASAAALWLLIVQAGVAVNPFANRPVPFAPDMFAPAFSGWLAGLYAFVGGTIMAANRRDERRILNTLLFANCAILLLGLIVRSGGGQTALDYWSLSRQGRFAGTIGNANVTAVVAGMMALLATGRLLHLLRDGTRRTGQRMTVISLLCHAAAWLVAITALLSTASRAPILLTAGLMILLTLRSVGQGRINWGRWALYALPALVLILAIGQAELFQQRLGDTSSEWGARLLLWSQYWKVAMDSPLYGYGLGGFQSVSLFTMPDIHFAEGSWIVNSAHNILLQLMLVGGIPYLCLMLALAAYVVRDIVRNRRASSWSTRRWSIVFAIVLMLICAMIDIVLDVTSTIMLMLFLSGMLWGRALFVNR